MIKLNLMQWSAISSLGDSNEETLRRLQDGVSCSESDEHSYPKITEIAASLRRRLTKLTKLVARLFFDTVPEEIQSTTPIIFLSESGEVQVLEKLLENSVEKEAYSPMNFCNSVHHTPTGYLSISTKNRGIARTISGGIDGFSAAIIEVASLLKKDSSTPVALIIGEERTPEVFNDSESYSFDYASLLLFGTGENDNSQLTIDESLFTQIVTEKMSYIDFCEKFITSVKQTSNGEGN